MSAEAAGLTLESLLAPRSVAVVGASDDPTRIGGRPIAYMKAAGFEGALHPVNSKRDLVQGLPAVRSVADIDGTIDYAIIAVPAAAVTETLRACHAKGARTCLVFSSGFAETGPEGAALQAELDRVARSLGVLLVGPNSLGLFNVQSRFMATFSTTLDRGLPEPGGLSIASQSGAYGTHIYFVARSRGIGVGSLVTTGNELQLDVARVIRLLADDPETDGIAAYMEGIGDGPALVEALETARANRKPVVVMKVGRSAVGAEAARAHSAALAGEDAVFDAVVRRHGAWRARSTEELIDIADACRARRFPTGRRLGIVTISGGGGALMADAAAEHGIEVPALPAAAQAELRAVLPFAAPRNPVDVTAQAVNDLSLVEANLRIMMAHGRFDALATFWTSVAGSPAIAGPLRAAFHRGLAGHGDKLVVQSLVAAPEVVRAYQDDGMPVFEDPSRAIAAIAALMHFGESFAAPPREPEPRPMATELPCGPLNEWDARRLLSEAGLPFVEARLAATADEAAEAAARFARPVALKLVSADLAHKAEIGGVLLDVADAEAARAGFDTLRERAQRSPSELAIQGVLVAPMVRGGVECLMGVKHDAVFGPILLFGLGGLFAEALADVSLRPAPVTTGEALEMIAEIKGAAILEGARGQAPVDRQALAEALVALSRFAVAQRDSVESVDLNPVVALPDGALALDALIVPCRSR